MEPEKERMMDDDRIALAKVETLVNGIREDIHEIREDFRRSNENKVTRPEWLQRNDTVDQRIHDQEKATALLREAVAKEIAIIKADHAKEIANLKTDVANDISEIKQDLASKRVPVTAWIAVVVSVLTFGWVIFGPIITAQPSSPSYPDQQQEQTTNE